MTDNWLMRAEEICHTCGGHCCTGAQPPLSSERIATILAEGDFAHCIGNNGYRFIRTKEHGECSMMQNGKCRIHAVKPETCRAGPFTFDVQENTIEIFLKFESICPVVRLLREEPEAYRQQYDLAVSQITRLVSQLSGNELEAICCIEEPETEKVAEIPRQYV
jgi:Fe-S-cluster containining protein